MELRTPQAIRTIKESHKKYAVVEGKKQCLLQAMSFACNYHKLDVSEFNGELVVRGTEPVRRVSRLLIS